MDSSQVFLAAVALVAGFVRGFAGFGGPLLLLPILNQFLVPAASMWVVMWVDLLVNVRLLPDARRHVCTDVLKPLMIGTLLTMPLGVMLLAATDPIIMKRVIGAAVLSAALIQLAGWRYQGEVSNGLWIAAGAISGLVMGATSIAVTVALFLSAGSSSVVQNRANFIVWAFITCVLLLILLVVQGALRPGYLGMIALLAPTYFIGTMAGARMYGKVPEPTVRRAVLLLAAAAGLAAVLI